VKGSPSLGVKGKTERSKKKKPRFTTETGIRQPVLKRKKNIIQRIETADMSLCAEGEGIGRPQIQGPQLGGGKKPGRIHEQQTPNGQPYPGGRGL